jgi:hypothetical protein
LHNYLKVLPFSAFFHHVICGSCAFIPSMTPRLSLCFVCLEIGMFLAFCALTPSAQTLGIEPQLYALRWVRLMFGREFHFADVLTLWDAILAWGQ